MSLFEVVSLNSGLHGFWDYNHLDNFHWITATRKIATQDNCHPDKCYLRRLTPLQLPPRATTTANCHLGICHKRQLPPRTIASGVGDATHPKSSDLRKIRAKSLKIRAKIAPNIAWFENMAPKYSEKHKNT